MNDETNFVYIIATLKDGIASAPVKVGITKSMAARFSTIKTASAYPLEIYTALPFPGRYDVQKLEEAFHKVMKRHRLHGEWFDLEPSVALQSMAQNIKFYLSLHLGLGDDDVAEVLAFLDLAA